MELQPVRVSSCQQTCLTTHALQDVEDFVFDYYAMNSDMDTTDADNANLPVIQVSGTVLHIRGISTVQQHASCSFFKRGS